MANNNMKRGRNNNRRRSGPNINRALDSTGPEVKIRGTAMQIHDKYQALARDAATSGDRVRAESLLQHAEHYFRLMKSVQQAQQNNNQQNANADAGNSEQPDVKDGDGEQKKNSRRPRRVVREESADVDADDKAEAKDDAEEAPKPKRRRRRPSAEEGADEKAAAE